MMLFQAPRNSRLASRLQDFLEACPAPLLGSTGRTHWRWRELLALLRQHELAALLDRLESLEEPLLAGGVVHEAISVEELDGAVDG